MNNTAAPTTTIRTATIRAYAIVSIPSAERYDLGQRVRLIGYSDSLASAEKRAAKAGRAVAVPVIDGKVVVPTRGATLAEMQARVAR